MACLAAIFSREFWLCSSHPAVMDFFAFRSKCWHAWRTCRVVVCGSASLWRWQQLSSCLFLYWRCTLPFFFCFLSFFSFFSFSGETKNTLLHDGNHYGLLSLGSMFCILYSRRDSASLWLEVGSLSCLCGNSAPWPQLLLGLWHGTEARLELSVPGLVLLGRPGRFFSLMWLSTWFLAETISVE